jgi:signal transduction histidine kinase
MRAVSSDENIPSADRLTMTTLQDHFPEMLRELAEAVREPRKSDAPAARETGSAHGRARWRSGYRIDELLRELARIREMVLKEIATIEPGEVSDEVRGNLNRTVLVFFDTIAATSARQFVDAQEAELVLRADQLEHAYEQVQAATQQFRLTAESRLTLLRAVTHELRNSIQPITFAAEALLEEPNPGNRQDISTKLYAAATRLQSLLDRLVRLSSLLSGKARLRLVPVYFSALLRDLETEHRPIAEIRGIRFESHESVGFSHAISDPDRLREIGEILLSNAIRFTTTGFVRLEMVAAEAERWIMRVTDSGSGIDPIDARRLFIELHTHGEAAQSSLRLGLVLARHLARLLGGEITFQSTIGQGSRFEVNLPRVCQPID